MLDVRRRTMGLVSQFLRVIPRVATVDVVAEPLLRLGADPAEARDRAEFLLPLLNIPQRLWPLPPATFAFAAALAHTRRGRRSRRPRRDRQRPPRRPRAGSREHFEKLVGSDPDLHPVLITAALDKLRARLDARGRKNAAAEAFVRLLATLRCSPGVRRRA